MTRSTTLVVSDQPSPSLATDALVLGVYAGDQGPGLVAGHGLPRRSASHLVQAIAALGLTGALGEVGCVPLTPGVAAGQVVLTGFGSGSARTTAYDPESVRRAIGAGVRGRGGTVAVVVPHPGLLGAVAEGAAFGAYAVSKVSDRAPVDESAPAASAGSTASAASAAVPTTITVVVDASWPDADRAAVVERAAALGDGVAWCRDLVNRPPNLLGPQEFVDEVRDVVRDAVAAGGARIADRLTVDVLDERALAHGGFGGILGVGQGSSRPPRLATLSWRPPAARASIALVGKGITFDSGGLCIKPPAGMLTMKSDMAGAAAAAAAAVTIARLDLAVAVTAYLALAENMPGAAAQRPGDVVTMRDGRTVEILDTDAEGRMVLADAITLAGELAPDAIVDIATLTGAQVMSLGDRVAALMADEDQFRDRVRAAARDSGELVWPMPLPPELRPSLDSPVADLAHKADRFGGMLTAGLFLREFVPSRADGTPVPWAHLDIAGPSYAAGADGYIPRGGTGFGVRTLVALVESYAATNPDRR